MVDKRLGALVAQGRTADIHAWEDEQTVVKLYHDWFQLDWIREEAAHSRAVQGLGLPIPKVGSLVRAIGRNGLLFERIDGQNMLALLKQTPEQVTTFATRLAKRHIELHALDAQPAIPLQRQKLESKIRRAAPLSEALKTALIDKLHTMPDGRSVCHGDFHPGNVVVRSQAGAGEAIVDWNDCTFGNPLADVARSTILFLGGITGNETPDPAFEQSVRNCHQQYLAHYFELSSHSQAEYEQWLPIVAGARLSENITALEPWLLSEAQKINKHTS
ncbi:MAG: phosphotransferase family protein [Candidatus Promineifilaceae bacterium]